MFNIYPFGALVAGWKGVGPVASALSEPLALDIIEASLTASKHTNN